MVSFLPKSIQRSRKANEEKRNAEALERAVRCLEETAELAPQQLEDALDLTAEAFGKHTGRAGDVFSCAMRCYEAVCDTRPDLENKMIEQLVVATSNGSVRSFLIDRLDDGSEETVRSVTKFLLDEGADDVHVCVSMLEANIRSVARTGNMEDFDAFLGRAIPTINRADYKTDIKPCLVSELPWVMDLELGKEKLDAIEITQRLARVLTTLRSHGFLGEYAGNTPYEQLLAVSCDYFDEYQEREQPITTLLAQGVGWGALADGDKMSAEVIRSHPAWKRAQLMEDLGQEATGRRQPRRM